MTEYFTRELADEAATLQAGRDFAKQLSAGMTVYLHGDLGAGKTTFVRGVLQGLGHEGKVKSPTYTLVEPYEFGDLQVYHFDLYRFVDEYEWDAAGFSEYFNEMSICMVEWPEKAGTLLPKPSVDVALKLAKVQLNSQAIGRTLIISKPEIMSKPEI
ncbi:MAG: tRNA (adenosine(37)-N6)-threonylcarbamoyltransferase complex ATPase subunit type 1 TsaE [Methylophilaceae bacterium]|jgi:tRNA threonylcarbamoyladenosine biosynthesis protein TsaE|nr:MAG: tRNA (adenosine(37)-N6)-threonylcarbamoyltransferase complex ATPase subunit type 1 TsaE [Methylophilaceae bacterium]